MEYSVDQESLQQLKEGTGAWNNIQTIFRQTFYSLIQNQGAFVDELNRLMEHAEGVNKQLKKAPTKKQLQEMAVALETELQSIAEGLRADLEAAQQQQASRWQERSANLVSTEILASLEARMDTKLDASASREYEAGQKRLEKVQDRLERRVLELEESVGQMEGRLSALGAKVDRLDHRLADSVTREELEGLLAPLRRELDHQAVVLSSKAESEVLEAMVDGKVGLADFEERLGEKVAKLSFSAFQADVGRVLSDHEKRLSSMDLQQRTQEQAFGKPSSFFPSSDPSSSSSSSQSPLRTARYSSSLPSPRIPPAPYSEEGEGFSSASFNLQAHLHQAKEGALLESLRRRADQMDQRLSESLEEVDRKLLASREDVAWLKEVVQEEVPSLADFKKAATRLTQLEVGAESLQASHNDLVTECIKLSGEVEGVDGKVRQAEEGLEERLAELSKESGERQQRLRAGLEKVASEVASLNELVEYLDSSQSEQAERVEEVGEDVRKLAREVAVLDQLSGTVHSQSSAIDGVSSQLSQTTSKLSDLELRALMVEEQLHLKAEQSSLDLTQRSLQQLQEKVRRSVEHQTPRPSSHSSSPPREYERPSYREESEFKGRDRHPSYGHSYTSTPLSSSSSSSSYPSDEILNAKLAYRPDSSQTNHHLESKSNTFADIYRKHGSPPRSTTHSSAPSSYSATDRLQELRKQKELLLRKMDRR